MDTFFSNSLWWYFSPLFSDHEYPYFKYAPDVWFMYNFHMENIQEFTQGQHICSDNPPCQQINQLVLTTLNNIGYYDSDFKHKKKFLL